MVRERYTRQYVYDESATDSGFVLINDCYDGDYKCPPFIPEAMSLEEALKVVDGGLVEFGSTVPDEIARYIKDSLVKLFVGEDSDWCIVAIETNPGELLLKLKNPKLKAAFELIRSLDLGNPGAVRLQCYDDMLDYMYFTVYPIKCDDNDLSSVRLKLCNPREDIVDEIDYFDICVTSLEAYILESHKVSRAYRNVRLTFNGEKDGNGHDIMVGEIVEVR